MIDMINPPPEICQKERIYRTIKIQRYAGRYAHIFTRCLEIECFCRPAAEEGNGSTRKAKRQGDRRKWRQDRRSSLLSRRFEGCSKVFPRQLEDWQSSVFPIFIGSHMLSL